jgi:putative nucleotidyltransferase with HDIG domain
MINLDDLIRPANNLAPLPTSATRLAGLISNPDFDLDEIVELIAFDQALTVKLLRAANATAVRIGTVWEAVTLLGGDTVFNLAIGAQPILQKAIPQYGLPAGCLWRHSVAAAASAEAIQALGNVELPSETFTAALLHDIGKLVMGQFLDSDILNFIRRAQEVDQLSEMQAENLLLNVHHAELGGLIAQHWKLPPRIVRGITYHHNPEQGLDIICDATFLCNQLAKQIEASLEGRKFEIVLPPETAERLELGPKSLEGLFAIALPRFKAV